MSTEQKCPIWGTPAEVMGENGKGNIIYHVNSPRAGGRYVIYGVSMRGPKSVEATLDIYAKVKLTDWIVEQNRFGVVPKISVEEIEEVRSWPEISILKRADSLLLYLYQRNDLVGFLDFFFYPEPIWNDDYALCCLYLLIYDRRRTERSGGDDGRS